MASIRKRGQKYQARIKINGKLHEKSFHCLEKAEQWAQEFAQPVVGEITSQSAGILTTGYRFADILRTYSEIYTPMKRGKDNELIIINAILKRETWVQLAPQHIGFKTLMAYRDERLKTIAASTFKREYAIIKHCAKQAKAMGYDGVDAEMFRGLPLPQVFDRDVPRITQQDQEKILFAAYVNRKRNKYMHPLIRLAIDTGIRKGELCKLTWDNVHWERQILDVPAPVSKTGKFRQVTLTVLGIEALRDLQSIKHKKGNMIIPASPNAVRCAWEHTRSNAGFPNLHFHDLRHEAISRMHEQGMTKPEIMAESGHKESQMLDRYSHSDIERRRMIRGGLNNG